MWLMLRAFLVASASPARAAEAPRAAPTVLGDGWQMADPQASRFDAAALCAVLDFRALQLPMNVLEASGALGLNNGPENRETVLECASREGIGVLVKSSAQRQRR